MSDKWWVPNWELLVHTPAVFAKEWQTKELRDTELGSVYGEWKTSQPLRRRDTEQRNKEDGLFLTLG